MKLLRKHKGSRRERELRRKLEKAKEKLKKKKLREREAAEAGEYFFPQAEGFARDGDLATYTAGK